MLDTWYRHIVVTSYPGHVGGGKSGLGTRLNSGCFIAYTLMTHPLVTYFSPLFLSTSRSGTAAVAPPPCLGEALLLPLVRALVCLLRARGSRLPLHFQWRSWKDEEEKEKGQERTVSDYGVHVARQCGEGQGGCYGNKCTSLQPHPRHILPQVQDLCGSFCTQLSSHLLNSELANQVSLNVLSSLFLCCNHGRLSCTEREESCVSC